MDIKLFLFQYRIPLIFGIVGCMMFLTVLLAVSKTSHTDNSSITIVDSTTTSESNNNIFIDIQGAINSPGVYEFDKEIRIIEAIEKAGNFAEGYDSVWVSKNLNQSQKVSDGMKLYIPYDSSNLSEENQVSENTTLYININSASKEQLESLTGVGEATALKIIEARPYGTIEELKTRDIIYDSTYEKIKDQISVY